MEIIQRENFQSKINCYFVIGNIGVGKSTFINYLMNNVEPNMVKFIDSWNFKQKILKDPKIGNKLLEAQTIIPTKYDITLNKEKAHIFDTPGFQIIDSYEQEIVS